MHTWKIKAEKLILADRYTLYYTYIYCDIKNNVQYGKQYHSRRILRPREYTIQSPPFRNTCQANCSKALIGGRRAQPVPISHNTVMPVR